MSGIRLSYYFPSYSAPSSSSSVSPAFLLFFSSTTITTRVDSDGTGNYLENTYIHWFGSQNMTIFILTFLTASLSLLRLSSSLLCMSGATEERTIPNMLKGERLREEEDGDGPGKWGKKSNYWRFRLKYIYRNEIFLLRSSSFNFFFWKVGSFRYNFSRLQSSMHCPQGNRA